MFVTKSALAQWVPEGLAPAGDQHWRAVLLSQETPLFFVRFTPSQAEDEDETTQTIGISWETTLRSFVEDLPTKVRSIARLSLKDGAWTIAQVDELWRPGPGESDTTGALLFSMTGQNDLVDTFGRTVTNRSSARTLIYRAAEMDPPGRGG